MLNSTPWFVTLIVPAAAVATAPPLRFSVLPRFTAPPFVGAMVAVAVLPLTVTLARCVLLLSVPPDQLKMPVTVRSVPSTGCET